MIYLLEALRPNEPPFTISVFRTRRRARLARLELFRHNWQWCRSLADLRISRIGVR